MMFGINVLHEISCTYPTSSSICSNIHLLKVKISSHQTRLSMCHTQVHEATSIISAMCHTSSLPRKQVYTYLISHALPMIIDQSAPMCQKWLSLRSTHAQVLLPRHHHHCNSITPKFPISILLIRSLFQACPYMYSKVCTPSCIKVPNLSSSMHQIL